MLVDYHMHTPLCYHAEGEPAEYVDRALALGLDEIGIAEHSPWMIQKPDERLAPTDEEFARVVETVQGLQRRYNHAGSHIKVRLGIEMDYVADRLDQARAYVNKYPWDYIIGSVHHLGEWGFDNPAYKFEFDERDVDQVFEEYFNKVAQMVATGFYDTVGHLDVIKKFGHRPKRPVEDLYRRIARVLKEADVVVEINTSGQDKEVGEFYPAPGLLKVLAETGVPITLGSDAHRPQEVGRHFEKARKLLLSFGVKQIVAYEARKRKMIDL